MDIARLGYEIDSSQAARASSDLDKMDASADRAEKGSRDLAVASNVSASALQAQAAAARTAAINQRLLLPQILQIGQAVPLAFQAPLAFMQQFAFQSVDIAQIYAGRGGVTAAIRDSASMIGRFTSRLAPLGVAIGVAALGFRGFQNDVRETTGETVSFGNIARATFQEVASVISSTVGPAIARLVPIFDAVANAIFATLKFLGNVIINTFEFAYRAVLGIWNNLPGALGNLAVQAAQRVADAINPILEFAPGVSPISIDNPFSGGTGGLGQALSEAYSVFENDRVGEFFGRVSSRAIDLTRSAGGAVEALNSTARAANDNLRPMDLLGSSFLAANDNAVKLRDALTGGLQAGLNGLRSALSDGKVTWQEWAQIGLSAIEQLIGGLFQLGNAQRGLPGGGGFLSNIFGGFSTGPSLLGQLFNTGGYTGSGGPLEPAGIVHRDEFVVRSPYARQFMPQLQAMNRGQFPQMSGGGTSVVRIELDSGLRAQIRSENRNDAIQIVQADRQDRVRQARLA